MYDERPHHRMPSNWDENRGDPEHSQRGNRPYEGNNSGNSNNNRNWEPPMSHERKRIDDMPPQSYKERQWNDAPQDKWMKDKDPQDWKRNSWKDNSNPHMPMNQSAPTMPHPRRWPGPMSDNWRPPHKSDSHPQSSSQGGPPFKPRSSSTFFAGGFKRFPYKRFPSQYSKINYPSKRVLPSTTMTTSNMNPQDDESNDKIMNEPQQQQQQQQSVVEKMDMNESGEIVPETEEDKIAQPDTTFSGTSADAQYPEEEGNLSEFSDVDDDILNREEVSSQHKHK
jgi:hypothetical protein